MKKPLISLLFALLSFQIASADAIPNNPYKIGFGLIEKNKMHPEMYYYELKPGDTYTDNFYIRNDTETKLKIKITPVDSFYNQNNEKFYKLLNETQNEFGLWTTSELKEVELEPNQKQTIKITFKIPDDTKTGKYVGGISLDPQPTNNNNEAIKINLRFVKPIELNISTTPQPNEKLNTNPFLEWKFAYLTISILLVLITSVFFIKGYKNNKK